MNPLSAIMNSSKKPKRAHSDSEDDFETISDSTTNSQPSNFPHFIVIESVDENKPITKVSPFAIEKQLSGILGTPKSVKNLKNGTILVECNTRQQSKNLLKNKTFVGQDVDIYAHKTLNSSRGVVRCKDLSCCTIDEIEENLSSQGVTAVKRVSVRRDGKTIQTNTYFLCFNTPTVPNYIKVGFLKVKVSVYVPNPMRCYRCQKFGHTESRCTRTPVCGRCSFVGEEHDHSTCTNEIKCLNCGGPHLSSSKQCPTWKLEKDTLTIKYTENVSFPDARKIAKTRLQLDENRPKSYAAAAQPASSSCQSCLTLTKRIVELEQKLDQLMRLNTSQTLNNTEQDNTQPDKSSVQSQNAANHEVVAAESDTQESTTTQSSRRGSRDNQKSAKAFGSDRRSISLSPNTSAKKPKPKKGQPSDRVKKAEKNLVLSNRFGGMEVDVEDVLDIHAPGTISPVRPPKRIK